MRDLYFAKLKNPLGRRLQISGSSSMEKAEAECLTNFGGYGNSKRRGVAWQILWVND